MKVASIFRKMMIVNFLLLVICQAISIVQSVTKLVFFSISTLPPKIPMAIQIMTSSLDRLLDRLPRNSYYIFYIFEKLIKIYMQKYLVLN